MSLNAPWMATGQSACTFKSRRKKPADLISICLTNYNYGCYIIDALDSIAAQTHTALDLVVVDDHSTKDGSVDLITAWMEANQKRFWRASLIVHARNLGPSAARNTAFGHAMGTFVFVMDADNTIYPAPLPACTKPRGMAGLTPRTARSSSSAASSALAWPTYGTRCRWRARTMWMSWRWSAGRPGWMWMATAILTQDGKITISG
ncbi:glycosyltransferase family 2 protein [Komagataeibacter rhaeticus]|nr:glycosyltransferase family 2 protein [Komagataeibacter rhaeticus]